MKASVCNTQDSLGTPDLRCQDQPIHDQENAPSPRPSDSGATLAKPKLPSSFPDSRSNAMNTSNHLPPELDPSKPDPTLEPPHEVGEQPGKRTSDDRNDPEVEPGSGQGKV